MDGDLIVLEHFELQVLGHGHRLQTIDGGGDLIAGKATQFR